MKNEKHPKEPREPFIFITHDPIMKSPRQGARPDISPMATENGSKKDRTFAMWMQFGVKPSCTSKVPRQTATAA